MRKVLTVLVAVLCVVGHGVAMASRLADIDRAVEGVHAALHGAEPSHHHHDDGSAHPHDDGEESQHSHPDCAGAACVALPVSDIVVAASDPVPSQLAFSERAHPPPFLEGPRRPPRTAA